MTKKWISGILLANALFAAVPALAVIKLDLPKVGSQSTTWSCGPNAAAKMLNFYGVNTTYVCLRDSSPKFSVMGFDIGPTPQLLVGHMNKNANETKYKAVLGDLGEVFNSLLAGHPVMIMIKHPGEIDLGFFGKAPQLHYIVINGFNEDTEKYTYTDNQDDEHEASAEEIEAMWYWQNKQDMAGMFLNAAQIHGKWMIVADPSASSSGSAKVDEQKQTPSTKDEKDNGNSSASGSTGADLGVD